MAVMQLAPLYPILDAELAAAQGHDLVACARGFAALGLAVQQLRAKTLSGGDFRELAVKLQTVVPRLIVNDRADIAALVGAAGVHLGQEDLPAAAARAVQPAGSEWIVGLSTHNPEQLKIAAAEDPAYVALGPIFATGSKANPDPVVGLEGLRAARAEVEIPLVAIGGITLENAAATRRAGADAVAVIAALWRAPDPVAAARALLVACG